jgi:predicted nicotinamide N-methyase
MPAFASPQTTPSIVPGSPGALLRLQKRFDLSQSQAKVADKTLRLPELADPLAYIQESMDGSQDGKKELPYWTKLWPAALVLAGLASGLKVPAGVDPSEPILELGAGMGLPGLAAALGGRRVVLTDIHPDALEFARAAVEMNHLDDLVEVRALDWMAPDANLGRYHTILGAEILYQRQLYPHLLMLLDMLLAPGGIAFISQQERPFNISFFKMLGSGFDLRTIQRKVNGAEGETKILLHALKRIG